MKKPSLKDLPRNVWAVSVTSFLMDISSEMVINILPLFLSNILGVKTNIIGLIEGIAEATASILKVFSGWISDRIGSRKWLTVAGYALSAISKPFYYFAVNWGIVAAVRWCDRVGKGIRTAPRDALVADSVSSEQRGMAFGFHRAADTAGAVLGLMISFGIVWFMQKTSKDLNLETFQIIVLISIIPAILAVISLIVGTKEVKIEGKRQAPRFAFRSLGKPFMVFMVIVSIFDLGNSSDAFLVLRAQERGVSVMGILAMLTVFNIVYSLSSLPSGLLSDRIGRRRLIVGGWLVYAAIYMGFALANRGWQIWVLYAFYGFYYGMAYGTTKAMISDLVPANLRGTAYGTYNGILGILDFPASLIAGILWSGLGKWGGFGPSAPFLFGSVLAVIAAVLFLFWKPPVLSKEEPV